MRPNPTKPARKTAQIILRVTPEQKAHFEEAAAATGRSLTDLATEALREKTLQIVTEQRDLEVWRLTRADAEAFAAAVLSPQEPSNQMVADIGAYQAMKADTFAPES